MMKTQPPAWLNPLLFVASFFFALYATDGNWVMYIPCMTAFGFFAVSMVSTGESRFNRTVIEQTVPLLSMGILIAVSLFWSPSRFISLFEVQTFVLLYSGIMLFAGASRKTILKALGLCLFPLGYLALQGLFQVLLQHRPFAQAHFHDTNLYGGLMYAGAAAITGMALEARTVGRKPLAALLGLAALLLGAAGFYAHSRGAGLALIVATSTALCFSRKTPASRNWKTWTIVGSLAVALVASTALKTRHDLAQHEGLGKSTNSRIAMWSATVEMIADHPIKGVGFGLWHIYYPQYRQEGDSDSAGYRAHNDYLEAWATGGPLALLAVLSIPGLWLFGLYRAKERLTGAALGVSVGAGLLCLQAVVNFIYHESGVAYWIGALIGAQFALTRIEDFEIMAQPRRKQLLMALIVPLLVTFSLLNYLAMAPSLIIGNTKGFEARWVPWTLNKPVLLTLARLNPFCSDPYFVLGHLAQLKSFTEKAPALQEKDIEEAFYYYDRAEERESIQPSIYARKALLVLTDPRLPRATRLDKAADYYRRALALDPAYYPAVKGYVLLLNEKNDRIEAARILNVAIEKEPVVRKVQYRNLLAQLAAGTLMRAGE